MNEVLKKNNNFFENSFKTLPKLFNWKWNIVKFYLAFWDRYNKGGRRFQDCHSKNISAYLISYKVQTVSGNWFVAVFHITHDGSEKILK